jgi:hypothetical protein
MPLDAERCAMADYLFVPQSVLDKWSDKGRVELEGHVLTLVKEKKAFQLTPAVRFIKMEAGGDEKKLLQKVKTLEALKQMGAEHYQESVILGESAYQVQQGFLADASALRRAAGVEQAAKTGAKGAPASAQKKPGEKEGEQDLLAQFLLENL